MVLSILPTALMLFALAQIFNSVSALQVAPGSSCATLCMDQGSHNGFDPNASNTNASDIVCLDKEYTSSAVGIKYKSCLECLQKSQKVNGSESDLHWYFYNLRYSIDTCLYSIPEGPVDTDVDSPCVTNYACGPLKDALTSDNLTSTGNDTYGYCSADNSEFMSSQLSSCISCLQSSGNQVYLSNFMIALEAGCEQKPDPGSLISLSGVLFSTDAVNITTPAENIEDEPKGAGSSTMTTGTIVGIAVGGGLALIGAIALFIVYRRKNKKQRYDEKYGYYGNKSESPEPLFPPQNTQMSASLRSYGSSGPSRDKGNMTTGEYYDRLEQEANTGGRRAYHYDPRSRARGPMGALPTHPAYMPRAISRNSQNPSSNPTPEPASIHQRSRSNTPDSYPLPSYPAPAATEQPSTSVPPPPRGPPPPKVPSLIMPLASKLRLPRQYVPPKVVVTGPEGAEEDEIEISGPIMTFDERFQDKPLAGGVVYADQAPNRPEGTGSNVPIGSGKSTLYGY